MTPFLKQVADHYGSGDRVQTTAFIFPNRRPIAFFRKHIASIRRDHPIFAPAMTTMNDFFMDLAELRLADRVEQLLILYDCYKEVNPKAESLDEFIPWGDVILADFADVDKYLADPKMVFANVKEIKQMQDLSFLSERQKVAIEAFVSNFRDGTLGDIKNRFLSIWNLLYPLYVRFNEDMESKGLAYEGMAYRKLAERLKKVPVTELLKERYPDDDFFVFVGLNALNECEKCLMKRMRDAKVAEFCWDYSGEMIRDKRNRSSFFMDGNVRDFPMSWALDDDPEARPEVKVVSVPSAVGQAKLLPEIFKEAGVLEKGGADPSETAVVLPDESLLPSVMNSVPTEISDINVTMGRQMTSSAFFSLMDDLLKMQLHLRRKGETWAFYSRQVLSIFSNNVFCAAGENADAAEALGGVAEVSAGISSLEKGAMAAVSRIRAGAKYYVPLEDFGASAFMRKIFRPVIQDPKKADAGAIRALGDYLKEVISTIAANIRGIDLLRPELEFARRYYGCVNILLGRELPVLPLTYAGLLGRLLSGETVPYEGEPLKGLQVMGPLETRALDFNNLVILSCNEGVFPRSSISPSFIPPELRKGFGLPTYEYQDAVWAYYFYRMIQRAGKVWLIYDSRTEGVKIGEESRYIKQLELSHGMKLERLVSAGEGEPSAGSQIRRLDGVGERLKKTWLSYSAISRFLECPAKFYYSTVEKLTKPDEVEESMDAGMFGNVYHATMEALYLGDFAMNPSFSMERKDVEKSSWKGRTVVDKAYIDSWLARPKEIEAKVEALMLDMLHAFEVRGRDLVTKELICQFVTNTLKMDKKILEENTDSKGEAVFVIKGLELKLTGTFHGFNLIGYIDRLDAIAHRMGELLTMDGTCRIIDYKTGKVGADEASITGKEEETVAKIFDPVPKKGKPSKPLQFFMYDYLLRYGGYRDETLLNCIYHPVEFGKEDGGDHSPKPEIYSDQFLAGMSESLGETLDRIQAPDQKFKMTDDTQSCADCDFKAICGR